MIKDLPQSLIEAASEILHGTLYESIMLVENRIQFLKDKNPDIDTSHDEFAVHRDSGAIIDHLSTHADPTNNKAFTPWIINQYKKKTFKQEDVGMVHNALSNFDRYKKKLEKKDIGQYKNVAEVQDAVQPHLGTAATKKEAAKEIEKQKSTIISQENTIKILQEVDCLKNN
jgi:hypothetical protein